MTRKRPSSTGRPVGTVPVLRGWLALELSPCTRIPPSRNSLACREDLVASRDRARFPCCGQHHRVLVLHGAPPA